MKNDIGYYSVNNVHYDNKFDAVLAAQLTQAEIKWNFFDEEFSTVNWAQEPELSLNQLYRIRAQQIRDKYDYVVVFCSGGADSTNVIRTFLDNNIHVDEVIALAPLSGLNNWNFDKNNLSEHNTISETKFALFPLLNEIASRNPNIKITINDFFEEMTKYKDEQWTFNACGNIVTALTAHFTDVLKFNHIDKLVQQGKRVGLVYGTDKPVIRIGENGDLYLAFVDAGINYLNMPGDRVHPNVDRVLFYWSSDLPEMLVKQAHIVAKAIHLPGNEHLVDYLKFRPKAVSTGTFQDYINQQVSNGLNPTTKDDILKEYMPGNGKLDSTTKFTGKSIFQRTIVPFIYPTTYTKDLFQCQKVDSDAGFFTTDQNWVHELHKNTRISDMILAGVKMLYSSISPKYLNINGTGFTNYYKLYKYGNVKDFAPVQVVNK